MGADDLSSPGAQKPKSSSLIIGRSDSPCYLSPTSGPVTSVTFIHRLLYRIACVSCDW